MWRPRYRETEHAQLSALAHSRALAHSLVRRAQIVLRSAAGDSNTAIARRFGVSVPLVSLWRKRYRAHGLAGLYHAPRSGRPRTHADEAVARMLKTVVQTKPAHATHWTVRDTADESRISKSSVHRYFTLFGVQPHRTRTFKISPDPFFVEKVRDIVGLYLHPPTKALMLCVDEKSQIHVEEHPNSGVLTHSPTRSSRRRSNRTSWRAEYLRLCQWRSD